MRAGNTCFRAWSPCFRRFAIEQASSLASWGGIDSFGLTSQVKAAAGLSTFCFVVSDDRNNSPG